MSGDCAIFFLWFIKKECHIERKSEDTVTSTDIVVTQFDGGIHVIDVVILQDSLGAFRVTGC